jgi:hypothetical protein
MRKDVKGSGRGLLEALHQHFLEGLIKTTRCVWIVGPCAVYKAQAAPHPHPTLTDDCKFTVRYKNSKFWEERMTPGVQTEVQVINRIISAEEFIETDL